MADIIKSRLDEVRIQLPPDVHADVIRDQSRFIKASVDAINEHLVIGGLLAFGVLGLFLGPVILAVTYTLLQHWIASGTDQIDWSRGANNG